MKHRQERETLQCSEVLCTKQKHIYTFIPNTILLLPHVSLPKVQVFGLFIRKARTLIRMILHPKFSDFT